jgi:CRP/FNR family transcriptional regulator, cyclic AMP receptor protein
MKEIEPANEMPVALRERLLAGARPFAIETGQILIAAGSPSREAYLLLTGRLQVRLFDLSGREVILRDVWAGELLGEFAALDGAPRSATIVAVEPATLVSIAPSVLLDAVGTIPRAGLWLSRRLVGQIRLLTDKVYELSALAARSRLHCELLRLAHGARPDGRGVIIEPSPTHGELAARIGSQREAVTREMRYLSDEAILAQERRRLRILDVARLSDQVRRVAGDHLTSEARHIEAFF